MFPPIPSWDAIHPLLIHFPIVLLLISPLFIAIAAALRPPGNRPYMTSALITLVLGTAGLFLAASSGEDAADLADRSGPVNAALATHEHLASTSEIVFTALLILFVSVYLWPIVSRRPQTRLSSSTAPLVFLVAYSVGLVYLVNTAHAGGRLVHEFGVHAMLPQENASDPQHLSPAASKRGEGD
jgi:uncharacterized membrane protein